MISRNRLAALVVAMLTAASLVLGVALAAGSGAPDPDPIEVHRQVSQQDVHPANGAVLAAFSAFAHPSQGSAATAAEQTVLRNALGSDAGAEYGPVSNADFSMARAAPIRGSSERAWLVPSGDHVCIVLPDPADGFGATCQTLQAISAGRGVLTLTPQPGSGSTTALVAVMVPDDGAAPSVKTAQGSSRLSVSGNVAASVVSTTDELTTSAGALLVAAG